MRPARIAARLGLVLASLAAATLGAEFAVRHYNVWGVHYYREVQRYLTEAIEMAPPEDPPDMGRIFQNRRGFRLDLRDFTFRTDDLGLRTDREGRHGSRAPEGSLPILFLGDSVTLAWGVDDADSWVRHLEREAEGPGGRPLHCMNAGHLMFDTVQEASLLRALGPQLQPEVVVLTFIYNDVQPTYDQIVAMTSGSGEFEPEPGLLRHLWGLRSLLRFRTELRRLETEDLATIPPYSHYPSGWPRCAAALADVQATCAALGSTLVINDHTTPPIEDLPAWCEERGVTYIRSSLSPEDQARLQVSRIDAHLNAEGNRRVAEVVHRALADQGLLAPPR